MKPAMIIVLLLLPALCGAAAEHEYELLYQIALTPKRGGAEAMLRIGSGANAVRQVRLNIDPDRHRDFSGDGEIARDGGYLVWTPPREGGALRYFAVLNHERDKGSWDALITKDWALFRGGDVFPPAAVRTLKGARARARLRVSAPAGWSVVTPYRETGDGVFQVDHPERGFDRPVGWMLAGKIGVRHTVAAGTRVAVAAPVGHQARRMDTLAFLRWTLPELRGVFPDFDDRLLIVLADDPMWRGGLSGPGSLYMHSGRPLISENSTSTLLHELVHVAMSVAGTGHDDWVVEGLAEYYSLELLRRSGAISERRYSRAIEQLADWGKPVRTLFVARVGGPVKARAATVFHGLDSAIDEATDGARSLDDIVERLLVNKLPFTYRSLCAVLGDLAPSAQPALSPSKVPGAQPADCPVTAKKPSA